MSSLAIYRYILIGLACCSHSLAFANLQRPSLHNHGGSSTSTSSSSSGGTALQAAIATTTQRTVGHAERPFPPSRKRLLSRVSFSWVTGLMEIGNKKVLQLNDLWAFEGADRAGNLSETFSKLFEHEKLLLKNDTSSAIVKSNNVIKDFWASPVTKAIVTMYKEPLVLSGVLKLCNTLVQFLPSLIIARLLGGIDKAKSLGIASASQGIPLALALFLVLSTKTLLENQYFYTVIDMGASIRGTLSASIYRKALKLSPSGRKNNTIGEIVNYMQIDTNRMEQVAGTIHVVWDGLLQIVGYTGLLLHFLGPSVFAGIAAMLVIIPLNAVFLKQLSALRVENLRHTDARVKLTSEILTGVRAIKSYNWEQPFVEKLTEIRAREIKSLKAAANTRAILVSVLSAAPSFVAVISLGVYALLGNVLTPTKVFTALALFNQLRFPLIFLPMLLNTLAEGRISLQRLTSFLLAEELQNYVETSDDVESSGTAISVQNATFSWAPALALTAETNTNMTRGSLENVDFNIQKGELVAIVGPVGSGKSTLMSGLLGELYKHSGRVSVTGSVAFVSQTAWIPNESLQNVILFGKEMNSTRYSEALQVCGLSRDLELLDSGDQTEIGERGVNLSGGQKQRVSIARAVYDDADIYLFDDPLSALDAQVSSKLFRDCIKGTLKSKTRVLTTHQLSILPEVDRVILMGKRPEDGSCYVVDQGTFSDLLRRGHDLSKITQPSAPAPDAAEMSVLPSEGQSLAGETMVLAQSPSPSEADNLSEQAAVETASTPGNHQAAEKVEAGAAVDKTAPRLKAKIPLKLMTTEERAEGAVGLDVYRSYLTAVNKPLLMIAVVSSFIFSNVCQQGQQWVVAAWTSDAAYSKLPLQAYLVGVTLMATGVAFFNWMRTYVGCLLGAEASQTIHLNMARQVLRAPLSFFESTPVGRLIQRFTKDLDQIDQQLPSSISQLVASSLNILASMMAIIFVTPLFSFVLLPLLALYTSVTNYYRGVARELKRLDSISRSPIFAHFGETLGGLPIIRSFERQAMFRGGNEVKLEDNMSAYFALKVVDRWLSIRLELLGNLVVLMSALLAVWSGSRAGPAGLSLNNALSMTSLLNWAVRNGAETESLMNSVERVMYTTNATPQEAPRLASFDPTAKSPLQGLLFPSGLKLPSNDTELLQDGWPWRGGIVFSDSVMRYREDMSSVLKGVSVDIQPGESIGIVGRTGSGKSSLFRALLRLTELEQGSIAIDGVNVASIGLDALRTSIAVIPQDPVLFSGSIRLNLDPFQTKDDAVLWEALKRANLEATVRSLPGGLSFELTEGGENFSQGQCQLMCLARALIRKTRIVLLDEATSSVDFKTDEIIQKTLRDEFGNGKATILCVAHRLSTIMNADRVLVMQDGRVAEFDSPKNLLSKPTSLFSKLVEAERSESTNKSSFRLSPPPVKVSAPAGGAVNVAVNVV